MAQGRMPLPNNMEQTISIEVYAGVNFLHVLTCFVEKAAIAFGLDGSAPMALTLAAEEIFVYFCKISAPDKKIKIQCSSPGYFVKLDFFLSVEKFNLRAFNITASISPENNSSMDEMGLYIASRKVDRFFLEQDKANGICLSLIKDKSYPVTKNFQMPLKSNPDTYSISKPDTDDIKLFAAMVSETFPKTLIPPSFYFPGKVVDMVLKKHYDLVLAFDDSHRICGGIIWQWYGKRIIEFFGPYLFIDNQNMKIPGELLDACIGSIAKTNAVALINQRPTEFFPGTQFEKLGNLKIYGHEKACQTLTTYFRQMQEDTGLIIKAHPDIMDFLSNEYKRLFLPREIKTIKNQGEEQNPYSVMASDFDHGNNMVTLRPIQPGKDALENLKNHIDLFKKESLYNLFFEMDLALSWQVGFTPALINNKFIPRLILPCAGKGDILIFQWKEDKS